MGTMGPPSETMKGGTRCVCVSSPRWVLFFPFIFCFTNDFCTIRLDVRKLRQRQRTYTTIHIDNWMIRGARDMSASRVPCKFFFSPFFWLLLTIFIIRLHEEAMTNACHHQQQYLEEWWARDMSASRVPCKFFFSPFFWLLLTIFMIWLHEEAMTNACHHQ